MVFIHIIDHILEYDRYLPDAENNKLNHIHDCLFMNVISLLVTHIFKEEHTKYPRIRCTFLVVLTLNNTCAMRVAESNGCKSA